MTHDAARSAPTLYRRLAGSYDLTTACLEPHRHRAVSHLRLQPGDVVVDVGCGTGMSFEPIHAAIVHYTGGPQTLKTLRTLVA